MPATRAVVKSRSGLVGVGGGPSGKVLETNGSAMRCGSPSREAGQPAFALIRAVRRFVVVAGAPVVVVRDE